MNTHPAFTRLAEHRRLFPASLGNRRILASWLPALILDAEHFEERPDIALSNREQAILDGARHRYRELTHQPWADLAHLYAAELATQERPR